MVRRGKEGGTDWFAAAASDRGKWKGRSNVCLRENCLNLSFLRTKEEKEGREEEAEVVVPPSV